MKVKTLSSDKLKLSASVPPRVRVSSSSSMSEIETVVMAVWFSAIVNVDAISIDGASLIELISTDTSADAVLSPWDKV